MVVQTLRSPIQLQEQHSLSGRELLEKLRKTPTYKQLTAQQKQVQKEALPILLSAASETQGKIRDEYNKSAKYISRLFALAFQNGSSQEVIESLAETGKILLFEIDLCIQHNYPAAGENLHKCSFSDIENKYKQFSDPSQPEIIRLNGPNIVGAALNRHDLRLADQIANEAQIYSEVLNNHPDVSIRNNMLTTISGAINKGNVEKIVNRVLSSYESTRKQLESSDSVIVRKYAPSLLSAGMARGNPESAIAFSTNLQLLYNDFLGDPSIIVRRHASTFIGIAIRKFSHLFSKKLASEAAEKYTKNRSNPYCFRAVSIAISSEDMKKADELLKNASSLERKLEKSKNKIHALFRTSIVRRVLNSSLSEVTHILKRIESLYASFSNSQDAVIQKNKMKIINCDILSPGFADKALSFYSDIKQSSNKFIRENADEIFRLSVSNIRALAGMQRILSAVEFADTCDFFLSSEYGNPRILTLIILKCASEKHADIALLKGTIKKLIDQMGTHQNDEEAFRSNVKSMLYLALTRSKRIINLYKNLEQIESESRTLIAVLNKDERSEIREASVKILGKALKRGIIQLPNEQNLIKFLGYKKHQQRKIAKKSKSNNTQTEEEIMNYLTEHPHQIISRNAHYLIKLQAATSIVDIEKICISLINEYERLCKDKSKFISMPEVASCIISYQLYRGQSDNFQMIKERAEINYDMLRLHESAIIRDCAFLMMFIMLRYKKLGAIKNLTQETLQLYESISTNNDSFIRSNADSLLKTFLRYESKQIIDMATGEQDSKPVWLEKLEDPSYIKIYRKLTNSDNEIISQNSSEILYLFMKCKSEHRQTILKLYHEYKIKKKPISGIVNLIRKELIS